MIHTRELGSGTPVVFLHGLFGSGENLTGLARGLPDGFRAVLADLPGHGRSSWIQDMRISRMADMLAAELLQKLECPAVVVGHSLGGKVAMALALQSPELVSATAVLDIAPVRYPDRHSHILDALLRVQQAQPQSRSQADTMLAQDVPDQMVRGFLMKNYDPQEVWRIPVDTLAEQYDALRDWDISSAVYSGASLCLYGGKSEYVVPAQHAAELQRFFPSINLVEIPGAGHWLHASHMAETSRELNRFIISAG
ncbi:alpha/beta fold hydrolase [Spirochaeta africana]|uniref:Putative hydrolase or acyltransferase of alpha/beta superfamily n=1 Tax=Spirochaeta africana (strain ATCC 700263 / DSM 8902 / Z-7692) TaxID=889378 RepID=H9UM89_SPIAZ|nr:alpha/beta fold hydrolase [Spirochaeta africana]AFG38632.1 putative hydrolase or acyltransferase of alpha/beta superfamily [Spirochaeta africana DSM 8902]